MAKKIKQGIAPAMRRTKGEEVYNVFNILFFLVFAFICVYPFYYLIINSISSNNASAAGQVRSTGGRRASIGRTTSRSSH